MKLDFENKDVSAIMETLHFGITNIEKTCASIEITQNLTECNSRKY